LEWLAGFCDRVLLLAEGRIAADGPPRQVLSSLEMGAVGLQPTRFTRAARLARESGAISPELDLPITLDQAAEIFQ
jgi:energy-coupling factor transport system ATP-binding protein